MLDIVLLGLSAFNTAFYYRTGGLPKTPRQGVSTDARALNAPSFR